MLNLDNAIAVTENFCNDGNFEKVWLETRAGRKKLSCKWLKLLKQSAPEKYELALELNKRDNFVMYDERERKKKKKKRSGSSSSSSSSNSSSSSSSSSSS